MEDVLGGVFLVLHVPDQRHSIGFVRSVLVVVIGGRQQLRILRGKRWQALYAGLTFDPVQLCKHRPEATSPGR